MIGRDLLEKAAMQLFSSATLKTAKKAPFLARTLGRGVERTAGFVVRHPFLSLLGGAVGYEWGKGVVNAVRAERQRKQIYGLK